MTYLHLDGRRSELDAVERMRLERLAIKELWEERIALLRTDMESLLGAARMEQLQEACEDGNWPRAGEVVVRALEPTQADIDAQVWAIYDREHYE